METLLNLSRSKEMIASISKWKSKNTHLHLYVRFYFFSSEWIFNGFILFHFIVIMILIGLPKQNLCTSDVPYSLTDFPRSDLHVSFPFSSKLFDLKWSYFGFTLSVILAVNIQPCRAIS